MSLASKSLQSPELIMDFLNKYAYNFGLIDEVSFLGKGGENMIFRINPFLPLEVIAKVTLSVGNLHDILTENHFIRLCENEEYICTVYEEVIAYSEEENKIKALVAIIGCAENDLFKMVEMWLDPKKAEDK